MATFTIPRNKVSYQDNTINEPYFSAYWGATITGTYLTNPYRLRITKVTVSGYIKCNYLPEGKIGRCSSTDSLALNIYSYKGTSTRVAQKQIGLTVTTNQNGTAVAGQTFSFAGSWSGSVDLELSGDGGKLRTLLFRNWNDYGMIWSSQSYPSDYVPINPDLSINVGSSNVNNINASLNSYKLTDLSSYSYTFTVYTDSARTQQAWTYTGSNINSFPLNWNGAVPGTTYYWKLTCSGVNSRTGGTVSMGAKTGTITTQSPWIAAETFTYTASPLYNNHWTPRTVVSYTLSESVSGDSADGLTFKNYEIQTALNGLNSNTKSHRVTALTGTIALTDTSKLKREAKPRDLLYIKVRVCCVDNAGREYFSDWFGILTPQYIYNKFHVYLSNPDGNNLRINSKVAFAGSNKENYWNKGEVK